MKNLPERLAGAYPDWFALCLTPWIPYLCVWALNQALELIVTVLFPASEAEGMDG